jgi:hypothetical protein
MRKTDPKNRAQAIQIKAEFEAENDRCARFEQCGMDLQDPA